METAPMPDDARSLSLRTAFVDIAQEAGALIMQGFSAEERRHWAKGDASPVTHYDQAAEALIEERLGALLPGVPIVAEEAHAEGRIPADLGERFLLVDPLDGTREFIAGIPDFTVNIALVLKGRPVLGVVHVPAHGETFVGGPEGASKWRDGAERAIRVRPPQVPAHALISYSRPVTPEIEAFLTEKGCGAPGRVGSSLKFCRVAEGAADLYPNLGRTMEWDTAAGQAVLEAAGGRVLRLDGTPLLYAKCAQAEDVDFANPPFVAWGGGAPA